ncbi:hypothetical protein PGB90_005844 [Kerria lacca]
MTSFRDIHGFVLYASTLTLANDESTGKYVRNEQFLETIFEKTKLINNNHLSPKVTSIIENINTVKLSQQQNTTSTTRIPLDNNNDSTRFQHKSTSMLPKFLAANSGSVIFPTNKLPTNRDYDKMRKVPNENKMFSPKVAGKPIIIESSTLAAINLTTTANVSTDHLNQTKVNNETFSIVQNVINIPTVSYNKEETNEQIEIINRNFVGGQKCPNGTDADTQGMCRNLIEQSNR